MTRHAAVLSLLLTITGLAHAEVTWQTSSAAAMQAARAQHRMLFVHFQDVCGKCNDKLDAMVAKGGSDPLFVHALDAYVPLRVTSQEQPDAIGDELARKHDGPVLAVYDASGVLLSLIDKRASWDGVLEDLLRYRAVRRQLVRAAELRVSGHVPEADMALGTALLNVGASGAATQRLTAAAKAFRAARQEEPAQMADILAASGWYASKQQGKGRMLVNDVIKKPATKAVEAEAHLMHAQMLEASSRKTVTRQMAMPSSASPRNRPQTAATIPVTTSSYTDPAALALAIESYRKAYDLAAPGSIVLEHSRRALARIDDRPLPPKEGMQTLLRLIPPARQTVIGDADFLVETSGGIARVDFYLDEVKVHSTEKAPFRAEIDVGSVPRARTVKAIGFDGGGAAKGEAVVTINDRVDAFFVNIVAPAAAKLAGTYPVELDVHVPPGRELKQVDVSWNGKDLASLKTAPFRTSVDVPAEEFGYLRAVALLDDGSSTEATRVYNSAGASASVEVGAVTVIASVSDKSGNRRAGLQSEDFAIEDEGMRVPAELRSSDDEPVTIGLAIDSSSSMRGRLVYAIRAATEFLGRALRPQDQAFVVAFDTGPRLVHPRSTDEASLQSAVYALTPQGGTSIFDGVTFALQQFQGVTGKKALLVFSDGQEGTSSASAKECERLARSVGVPVYLVVPPRGEKGQHALKSISDLTGGVMFYDAPVESFPSVFDRLAAEMRGQYVLSFTRPPGVKPGTWRTLRVTVKDANVRTIQGYRAN
jgi:Ca-activated chloride channel family protein